MDGSLGAFSLILLAIPGIALKIAVRAVYGRRVAVVRDPLEAGLSLASTLLIVLAVLGTIIGLVGVWWVLIVLAVLVVVVFFMVVDRLRRAEHRALLWSLAACAEKGIPLSEAARAYADETLGNTGSRALRLAQALDQGKTLSQAATAARLRMAPAMRLAIGLGESLGMLGPAMKQQLDDSQQADAALRDAVMRFTYLGGVLLLLAAAVLYLMINVVPVYMGMFRDFDLELPTPTLLVINLSQLVVNHPFYVLRYLTIPLTAIGLVALVVYLKDKFQTDFGDRPVEWFSTQPHRSFGAIVIIALAVLLTPVWVWPLFILILITLPFGAALHVIGFMPRDLPIIWRLFRRYDGALVLRGLALGVRRGLPLNQALDAVAMCYPVSRISGLLERISNEIAYGQNWQECLRRSRLISHADAAVLAAAERAGNLTWALEEMADSALRRQTYRVQVAMHLIFPPALLAVGMIVALFAIGLFLPLISLVQGLA